MTSHIKTSKVVLEGLKKRTPSTPLERKAMGSENTPTNAFTETRTSVPMLGKTNSDHGSQVTQLTEGNIRLTPNKSLRHPLNNLPDTYSLPTGVGTCRDRKRTLQSSFVHSLGIDYVNTRAIVFDINPYPGLPPQGACAPNRTRGVHWTVNRRLHLMYLCIFDVIILI